MANEINTTGVVNDLAITAEDREMAEFIRDKLDVDAPFSYVFTREEGLSGVIIDGEFNLEELARDIRLYVIDRTIKLAVASLREAEEQGNVPF